MEGTAHQEPQVNFGFYASIPRVVRTGYKKLTHAEKWLYTCLKDLCGESGTCYRTLRTLEEETDFSIASLSTMIRKLHTEGLIHAVKKRRSNNPQGKEVWHITIVDIWQLNGTTHPTPKRRSENEQQCSPNEQSAENVQNMNNNVQNMNETGKDCSENEQQCSNFSNRSNINRSTISNEEEVSEETTDISGLDSRAQKVPSSAPDSLSDKKRGKPERPSKPKSTKSEPAPLSAQEQAVYDEWRGIFNKPIPLTDALRKHIDALVASEITSGEIVACRLWMYANDTKGWYKTHGLGLGDVVRDLERFRSLNYVPESVPTPKRDEVYIPPRPVRFDYEKLRTEGRR